jgi:two-component system sensor histidine kinase CiaH
MFQSLRLRLIACVAGVLAVVLLATGALVYVLLARQLDDLIDAELRAAVARSMPGPRMAPLLPPANDSGSEDVFQVRFVADDLRLGGRRLSQSGEAGDGWREMSRSGPAPPGLPVQEAIAAARPGKDDLRTVTLDGDRYRLITRVTGTDNRVLTVTQAGMSLAVRDRQEHIVLLALAGGGLLGLGLTLAGGLFLTGRALAPVRDAFERQRRFVADASHELRTPLALLRLEAEDLAERAGHDLNVRPLVRQVDRLSRLTDGLLALAKLDEGGAPVEREPVHVESLLRSSGAQAERLAAPGVRIECVADPDLWVLGEPERLAQVLLILVDNACRATPSGGHIRLSAARHDGSAVLTVEDTGPGIPAEHIDRVFERFYRVDKSRSRQSGGAGLGLSIAREIVQAHGGEVWLESSAAGTRASVRIAAAPSH